MLLDVRDLSVSYGSAQALRGVSLTVDDAEVVALIGANGAGKTTLLRTISGLKRAVSGETTFLGERIETTSSHRIVKMGVAHVPEGRMVFGPMTVLDNLRMGAYLRRDRRGVEEDMERMFTLFPVLEERRRQQAESLSGGEQQMLAVARALMAKPRLLLMDEPSMGLSPRMVEHVGEMIRDIHATGISVLLVEQNATMALALADRAYVLEVGAVTLACSAEEASCNDAVRQAYLGGERDVRETTISTDVLVVGGGMAGCFAAVKAREAGRDVVLVDKGYVSKSGETPYAGDTTVFHPEWGHDLGAWLTQVRTVGEYLNDPRWTEIVFRDSYERFLDLREWGVEFLEEGGEPVRLNHPLTQIELPDQGKFPPLVSQVVHWLPGFPTAMRKQLLRSGVKVVDRFVVTELLQQDGRVVGAVGFDVEGNQPRVIHASATVMCAGGGGFKPVGYPTHELTADGHVMAYRAGAEITGKEFLSPHHTDPEQPGWPPMYLFFSAGHSAALPGMWRDEAMVNAEGDEVPLRGMAWHGWIDAEWEAHEGRAPVVMENRKDGSLRRVSGPGGHGSMLGHAAGGIVPVDETCATHVPGLFAAGDSCGTCFVGAAYSGFGFATMHAAVTGARAGTGAAEYARSADAAAPDAGSVADATARLLAPLRRKGGFSPRWTTQVLQNALAPYFVLYIKKDERLRAALTTVAFLRDQVVPNLYARDDHELRLAHETANMVANAEMKLTASLFRTESRGTHYREDFPRRGDPDWLVWVRLKDEGGLMTPFSEPIPEEHRPDRALPYAQRYPMRLPGEEAP